MLSLSLGWCHPSVGGGTAVAIVGRDAIETAVVCAITLASTTSSALVIEALGVALVYSPKVNTKSCSHRLSVGDGEGSGEHLGRHAGNELFSIDR